MISRKKSVFPPLILKTHIKNTKAPGSDLSVLKWLLITLPGFVIHRESLLSASISHFTLNHNLIKMLIVNKNSRYIKGSLLTSSYYLVRDLYHSLISYSLLHYKKP